MTDITAVLSVGVSYVVSTSTGSDPSIDWYKFDIHTTIRDKNGYWFWKRMDCTLDIDKPFLYNPTNRHNIHITYQHKNGY